MADLPSPMARSRVNCIACHMAKENDTQSADVMGQTFVATQDRCDYCHGDKYKGVLADWKKMLDADLTKAEAALLAAKTAVGKATLGAEAALQVQRAIDDAEFNIRFVTLAHGVHNPTYATALLNVALERCGTAQQILRGGVVTP